MGQDDQTPVIEELDKKIGSLKSAREKQSLETKSMAGISYAFRMTTEMAAALAVGAGVGWLMDQWIGTTPWGMIIFLFVGFLAGILNAYRTARRIADI